MLAGRLLRVAGSGTALIDAGTHTLTSNPKGGWTIPNPAAWYDADAERTFFIYVNADDGGHEIGQYDPTSRTGPSILSIIT